MLCRHIVVDSKVRAHGIKPCMMLHWPILYCTENCSWDNCKFKIKNDPVFSSNMCDIDCLQQSLYNICPLPILFGTVQKVIKPNKVRKASSIKKFASKLYNKSLSAYIKEKVSSPAKNHLNSIKSCKRVMCGSCATVPYRCAVPFRNWMKNGFQYSNIFHILLAQRLILWNVLRMFKEWRLYIPSFDIW